MTYLSNYIENIKGKIIKEDFFDINKPLDVNSGVLTQDMILIEFNNGRYVLDSGWYEDYFDKKWCFVVQIIYNYDWDSPMFYEVITDIKGVLPAIKYALKKIDRLILLDGDIIGNPPIPR